MTKTDRRVQRTRELLQKALIELISERGYDAITIQDIVGSRQRRAYHLLSALQQQRRIIHELPRSHRQRVPFRAALPSLALPRRTAVA